MMRQIGSMEEELSEYDWKPYKYDRTKQEKRVDISSLFSPKKETPGLFEESQL